MIITRKLARVEQIQKFRKMVGESMHEQQLAEEVAALAHDIQSGDIDDDAQMGECYTAGELRAVGAWYTEQAFVQELTSVYVMNVVLTIADKLRINRAQEQQEIMRAITLYAQRHVDVAEAVQEHLIDTYGNGTFNQEAADLCHKKREAFLNSMSEATRKEAERLTKQIIGA